MRSRHRSLGLPLLARELTEQAARKRTYVVRTLYATALFVIALLAFNVELGGEFDPLATLGRGAELFRMIVSLQFAGIFLFMPALAASAFTYEKERNSLALLFLTRLGPWAILFEKLLSRLVPMGTFLLLAMPLLAISYLLGGVGQDMLLSSGWILLLTALQVAALGLCCSAWFRTTVGAFIGTYVLGLVLFVIPTLSQALLALAHWVILSQIFGAPPSQSLPRNALWQLFGPDLLARHPVSSFATVARASVPMLISIGVLLVLTRLLLVRRAFVQPQNLVMKVFRKLDRFFLAVNQALAGGVLIVKESTTLPDDQPVAWRETSKRSLGTVRYLFRMFILLETPAVFAVLMAFGGSSSQNLGFVSGMLLVVWMIVALILSVASTSLITGERSRETLDVLLSTPMSTQSILEQKVRGVHRMRLVLCVPLATLIFIRFLSQFGLSGAQLVTYVTSSGLSLIVYSSFLIWGSLWVGLRIRKQNQAILAALAGLTALCLVPLVIGTLSNEPWAIMFLSPVRMLVWNETDPHYQMVSPSIMFYNYAIYGGLTLLARRRCFDFADEYLGRMEPMRLQSGPPGALTAEHEASLEDMADDERMTALLTARVKRT